MLRNTKWASEPGRFTPASHRIHDRLDPDTDLPDHDLRAAVCRRVPEQGLFLLALRQPDGQGAGTQARRPRRRCRLRLFRHRHERDPGVMLAFLSAGEHAIISDVAYGGTYRLCTKILTRFGIEFTFADGSNADAVAAAVRDNTKLILTETPANPTMKCSDIAAISKIATEGRRGARGRQHLSDALLPAAARTRCRHFDPQHDQVHGRPQRDRRRRGDQQVGRACRRRALHPEQHRHDHVAAGCLADAAGLQDPVGSHGRAVRERDGDRNFLEAHPKVEQVCTRASSPSRSTSCRSARRPVTARCSGSRSRAASRPARS